jgi:endonuclease III
MTNLKTPEESNVNNLRCNRRKELFDRVIQYFQETMPVVGTELHYQDPFHLLVAVILSAQCTDKRVNQITPQLLKHYPDPQTMALAEPEDLLIYIGSCSYPNNKARHLVGMSRKLIELYGGKVPSDIGELQLLPGVGRKTANVIASVIFNKPAMAVDTHVFRVAARLGLSVHSKTPLETEKQLIEFIPDDLIPIAHHWLILHGRYVCKARNPECRACGLQEVCGYYTGIR